MYQDFRALDPSKYLDEVSPGRTATVIVAAVNSSLQARAQADYVCDGVADDVEINAALNILPASGGRVMLSEGTFTLAAPITIPANNITLRGQGRSTLIDGNGLATGEHAIVIDGVTNACVKKLSIQTEAGGGKTSHCIFIEDGANEFEIEYVTILNSDSDAIHIEGTTIVDGSIHNCHINDADDYGIYVSMDAANAMLRLHIFDNFITGAGNAGIALWGAALVGNSSYCDISGNIVYSNGNEGIIIWNSDYAILNANLSILNTQWGIRVRSCDHVNLSNNLGYLNGSDNIMLEASNECTVEGNTCVAAQGVGMSDGIQIEGTDNNVLGNHCHLNGRHGINILVAGNRAVVGGNTCLSNQEHGINVAAPDCEVNSNYCYSNSQRTDATYHGINLEGTADRCQINDNHCIGDGTDQDDGIHLEDGANEVQIVGNYCYNGTGSGIILVANNNDCLIKDNYCNTNTRYGVEIVAASCGSSVVGNNKLIGNTIGAVLDTGTDTQLPFIYEPVHNPDAFIGNHPAEELIDGVITTTRLSLYVPAEFQELVRIQAFVVAAAAGDMNYDVDTDYGKVCSAEDYNTHSAAIADQTHACLINDIECVDLAPATTLADLAASDLVGIEFSRDAVAVTDTIVGSVYLIGVRLQYV